MIGSPELQLAVECCRRNFGIEPRDLPAPVDWDGFLELAKFHRIEGLVSRALREEATVPRPVKESLHTAAASIAAHNLLCTAASRDLLGQFEASGVAVLFVKGLTLGALAYGDAIVKSAIDIDLLIDSADLARAAACLRAAGFELVAPRRSLDRWHRTWKESIWRKGDLQIDLHTRLADNRRIIPTIDVHSPRQSVDIVSGVNLPTLADDELLAYLMVHGASSGWFRLKWIADFAALLSRRPAQELEALYERSLELGSGRAAGQALLLADALFDTLKSLPHLSECLKRDRMTRRLLQTALKLIASAPREPTERVLGTMEIHASQLVLRRGLSYKATTIRQQARQILTRMTI